MNINITFYEVLPKKYSKSVKFCSVESIILFWYSHLFKQIFSWYLLVRDPVLIKGLLYYGLKSKQIKFKLKKKRPNSNTKILLSLHEK